MTKADLLQKLKALDGLSPDERAYLIDLVNTRKKYGLVWEDKPEDVEDQLRTQLPVLQEVPDKRILGRDLPAPTPQAPELFETAAPDPATYPDHVLIEGDNLHALTALSFTHEGKIDLIYIDPPYNTGNKDFKYNDSYVDKDDAYRHSKWLSFMHKRLILAKLLLSDSGVIFISIDDNEQAQLKMLCDEVFGEGNLAGIIIWKNATDNNPTRIATEHEYIVTYVKNNNSNSKEWKSTSLAAKDKIMEIGDRLIQQYSDVHILQKIYSKWFSENKTYLWPFDDYKFIDPDGVYTGSRSVHNPGKEGYRYDIIHPKTLKPCKEPLMGYRFPKETADRLFEEGRFIFGEDESKIIELKLYAKDYRMKLSSVIELDGRKGANELKSTFNDSVVNFKNPKPTELLTELISFVTQKGSTILDFFAGSGTTLHAVMQLNAEDGGQRQCIMVTNNENNICEEVTYARNRRVIEGYTNSKGQAVPGLRHNNLRYYRSAFADRTSSVANKKALTRLATELLCIKEGCYTECTRAVTGQDLPWIGLFTDEAGQYLCVIYEDGQIGEGVLVLQRLIAQQDPKRPIKVYVFSYGAYAYTDEFEEILDSISLCALPDAIYKAYQQVLPGKKRPQEEEEAAVVPQPTLLDD